MCVCDTKVFLRFAIFMRKSAQYEKQSVCKRKTLSLLTFLLYSQIASWEILKKGLTKNWISQRICSFFVNVVPNYKSVCNHILCILSVGRKILTREYLCHKNHVSFLAWNIIHFCLCLLHLKEKLLFYFVSREQRSLHFF